MSSADTDKHIRQDARLVILRELAVQANHRLTSSVLALTLQDFGHDKPREWVNTQIRWLEGMSAVAVAEAGSVLVVTLRRAGLDHVHRRAWIEGVARPSANP